MGTIKAKTMRNAEKRKLAARNAGFVVIKGVPSNAIRLTLTFGFRYRRASRTTFPPWE
jgi:hypothetical protein